MRTYFDDLVNSIGDELFCCSKCVIWCYDIYGFNVSSVFMMLSSFNIWRTFIQVCSWFDLIYVYHPKSIMGAWGWGLRIRFRIKIINRQRLLLLIIAEITAEGGDPHSEVDLYCSGNIEVVWPILALAHTEENTREICGENVENPNDRNTTNHKKEIHF